MIKEKTIMLNMNGRKLSWYRDKGYDVSQHSIVEINPFDLPPTSKNKVTAICEECSTERIVVVADYSPLCIKCSAPKNSKGHEYSGENNPNYNHSMSDEERELYKTRSRACEHIEWSFNIKKRDSFTCQLCGDDKGGNLCSHHLDNFSAFKELRTSIDNGICLCEACHKDFHSKYGYKNNTKEQFEEFKINRMEVAHV